MLDLVECHTIQQAFRKIPQTFPTRIRGAFLFAIEIINDKSPNCAICPTHLPHRTNQPPLQCYARLKQTPLAIIQDTLTDTIALQAACYATNKKSPVAYHYKARALAAWQRKAWF